MTERAARPHRRPGGRAALVGLAAASAIVACGSQASSSSSAPPQIASVRLDHVPDGVVALTWDTATKQVTASVDLYGAGPGESLMLLVRTGSCLAPGDATLVTFPQLTAGPGGALTTQVTSDAPVPGGVVEGSAIVVAPAGAATPDATLLCTDVPAAGATGPLRLYAPPQLKPAGTATLVYDASARTLTVRVTAIGLRPSTAYGAHLGRGSCRAQGAEVDGVGGVSADASGNASATASLSGVEQPPANGWYLAVDRPASGPGGGPLLCGDIGW